VEKAIRDHVLALSNEMKAFKSGQMQEEEYRAYAKKELWLDIPDEEIYKTLRESYEIDEKVQQLAVTLKEKWYKLGICSNNFPTRIRELDTRFHFLDLFDVKVFSYEVWSMKPDTKIFQELVLQAWLPASSVIYADDKEEKLAGAKSLWMQTFVFTNFDGFLHDLRGCWVAL
jgi:HAD superfamily hydrolase (TIGR01509 family)